jgi:hypothetical protein
MSLSRPTTLELTGNPDDTNVKGTEKAVQTRWSVVAPAAEKNRDVTVYNAGPGTVVLDFGATAPKGFMVELVPQAYWESPSPTIEPLQAKSTMNNTKIYVREFV